MSPNMEKATPVLAAVATSPEGDQAAGYDAKKYARPANRLRDRRRAGTLQPEVPVVTEVTGAGRGSLSARSQLPGFPAGRSCRSRGLRALADAVVVIVVPAEPDVRLVATRGRKALTSAVETLQPARL